MNKGVNAITVLRVSEYQDIPLNAFKPRLNLDIGS